jgi:hypothetical protein
VCCWERRLETESGVGELEKCHVLLDNKRRVPDDRHVHLLQTRSHGSDAGAAVIGPGR